MTELLDSLILQQRSNAGRRLNSEEESLARTVSPSGYLRARRICGSIVDRYMVRRGTSFKTGDRRATSLKTGDAPRFKTGDFVPETGIYLVVHTSHRLPHEVVILAGERFPRCCRCSEPVLFSLMHSAPDLYQHFVYRIYELPEVEAA